MFDDVFKEMPAHLRLQRAQLEREFGSESPAAAG
jgi:hypothetical protein